MAKRDDRNLTLEDEKFLERHKDGLSDSTTRAKWIHSGDEHADRDGQTLATRSHEVIQQWAQARKAKPATVPGSRPDGHVGVLRFDFQGKDDDRLEEIGWDDWFEPFDERELVFIYQERMSDGSQSNFFRLDNPGS